MKTEIEGNNLHKYNVGFSFEVERNAERDAIALIGGNAYTLARLNLREAVQEMSRSDKFRLFKVERFAKRFSMTPDDVGTMEIEYYCPTLNAFNHALFGVTADGKVTCYAN